MGVASSPSVSAETLVQRARDLVPALKQRARQTEELRHVPEETIRELKDAGLFDIATPARFGGTGHEIDTMYRVAMELGRGCGSTAWCFSVMSIHNWMAGHWPMAFQEEYFAPGADTLSSSSFAALGKLTPVEGGYRMSGHWEFSSGSDAGTWALLGAMSETGPVFTMVPRPEYEILHDTWHVSGLKGTGSKDIVLKGAFVPEHRLLPFGKLGPASGMSEVHGRASYRLPGMALLPFTLASPLVGMAQGAVDDVVERYSGTSGTGRSAESVGLQMRLAEASVEADTARLIVLHDVTRMIERMASGGTLSEVEMAGYRRDVSYVSRLCTAAVDRLFEASGGHSLFEDHPMQRFHRDVHAGAHQSALYWDGVAEAYGRAAFGLPPLQPFLPGQSRSSH
jgi:alkylation response protein AidB-like acyl-CoA dehydrogenase